jgi:hypothetical protein
MDNAEWYCPKCSKPLEGAVEVIRFTHRGLPLLLLRETPDRNWIRCKGCGKNRCKQCCRYPDSGYCNRCVDYLKQVASQGMETVPIKVTFVWLRMLRDVNIDQQNIQSLEGGKIQ